MLSKVHLVTTIIAHKVLRGKSLHRKRLYNIYINKAYLSIYRGWDEAVSKWRGFSLKQCLINDYHLYHASLQEIWGEFNKEMICVENMY